MSNPILDLLNSQNNQNATGQQYNPVYRNESLNPMEIMIRQHPYYNDVMNYIQQNGGGSKAAFFNLCRQRGFNPDQIISSIQNKG